jgi:hypothetical protein
LIFDDLLIFAGRLIFALSICVGQWTLDQLYVGRLFVGQVTVGLMIVGQGIVGVYFDLATE